MYFCFCADYFQGEIISADNCADFKNWESRFFGWNSKGEWKFLWNSGIRVISPGEKMYRNNQVGVQSIGWGRKGYCRLSR